MTAALTDPLKAEVALVRLSSIRPCPENDGVYGKQSLDDPNILSLIASIRAKGVLEPIQISADNVIISGHRRRFCAEHAGLRVVPVIRHEISYAKDRDAFLKLLVEMNEQRVKTAATVLREAAMKVDPAQARAEMRQEQKDKEEERLYGSQVADHLIDWKDMSAKEDHQGQDAAPQSRVGGHQRQSGVLAAVGSPDTLSTAGTGRAAQARLEARQPVCERREELQRPDGPVGPRQDRGAHPVGGYRR